MDRHLYQPSETHVKITVPIVCLQDAYSVSIAETVAMALHAMPNTFLVGETTWGATGPYTNEELYNAGPFSIPGFMNVTTSSCIFKYIDNQRYEGIGFPPDINVPFNLGELNMGIDRQLEKAISLMNQ